MNAINCFRPVAGRGPDVQHMPQPRLGRRSRTRVRFGFGRARDGGPQVSCVGRRCSFARSYCYGKSVYVVRALVKLREVLASNTVLARRPETLERSVAALDADTRKKFDQVYEAILGLMSTGRRKSQESPWPGAPIHRSLVTRLECQRMRERRCAEARPSAPRKLYGSPPPPASCPAMGRARPGDPCIFRSATFRWRISALELRASNTPVSNDQSHTALPRSSCRTRPPDSVVVLTMFAGIFKLDCLNSSSCFEMWRAAPK